MSQDTFPFAGGGDELAPYSDEGEHNRKAVFVAGGVAAGLVLLAGGWFMFGGSGGDSATNLGAITPGVKRPAAAAPATVAKAAKKLPTAYTARLGRDPFKALYVVPAAAPVTTATTPTGTTTTTGTSPTGTTTGTTGTTPTSTTPTAGRYTVKLVAISKPSPEVRTATWTVDGAKVVVIPAQRFGKFGEIVVLAYSQNATGAVDGAIIQVGDDSPMDVRIGESVSVL
jgi:hypothetical protein